VPRIPSEASEGCRAEARRRTARPRPRRHGPRSRLKFRKQPHAK